MAKKKRRRVREYEDPTLVEIGLALAGAMERGELDTKPEHRHLMPFQKDLESAIADAKVKRAITPKIAPDAARPG